MAVRNLMRWTVAITVLLLLAQAAGAMANPEIAPPGSPNFQTGYVHGCRSGYNDAGRYGYQTLGYRDEQLYATDSDYRAGWDLGRHNCYEYESNHPHFWRPR